jgi:hypothetical protein
MYCLTAVARWAFPDLEQVTQARFPAPSPDDLGDAQAAGLLRTALRIGFRSSAGPFRSLASIAVEPRSYQLVPLLMAIRQQTVRLAICDDVGLGKTIESGLIAAELLAQGEAKGLAVLCSPALAEQWQAELRVKFGIDAELVLASTVPRLERALAYGQSLFKKHRIVVVSADFIKSPRHRDDFVKHCPDLVIVDEAHTFVPTGGRGAKSAERAVVGHYPVGGDDCCAPSFSGRQKDQPGAQCLGQPRLDLETAVRRPRIGMQ